MMDNLFRNIFFKNRTYHFVGLSAFKVPSLAQSDVVKSVSTRDPGLICQLF